MLEKSYLQKVLEACQNKPTEYYDLLDLAFEDDTTLSEKFLPEAQTQILYESQQIIDGCIDAGYLVVREVHTFIRIKSLKGGKPELIPTQRNRHCITFKGKWKLHQLQSIDLLNK
jgi:hypothetical protein